MNVTNTHYEVFLKKNSKADWSLVESVPERNSAILLAQSLKRKNSESSIRVTCETWVDAERLFRSIVILSEGSDPFEESKIEKLEASIPCLTPDDLRQSDALITIRHVLDSWLTQRSVTPLELVYRSDLVEELDNTEQALQHAIQKIALSRSQGSEIPVHAFIKLLNALVEKAINQVHHEVKTEKPLPKAKTFAQEAECVLAEKHAQKRLYKLICRHLKPANGYAEKLEILLDLYENRPKDPKAEKHVSKALDNFIAETISFESTRQTLTGLVDNLGEAVSRFTAIYEGNAQSDDLDAAPELARRLVTQLKRQHFARTYKAIANHILTALRSPKRLIPSSVVKEMELNRKLAQRLILLTSDYLRAETLIEVFTHRSARLLSASSIEDALDDCVDPSHRIRRLCKMEDNIVGDGNKSKLALYIHTNLASKSAEDFYVRANGQPFERLAVLAALQIRFNACGFCQEDKHELCKLADKLGLTIIDESKILTSITQSNQPVLDQVIAFLKLINQNILPNGRCSQDAKTRVLRILKSEKGRQESSRSENTEQLTLIKKLMKSMPT